MDKYRLKLIIRIAALLAFLPMLSVIAHAESALILVDHSESMAAIQKQDEAWIDSAHFFEQLSNDDLVSFNYFGGSNGGDCRAEVKLNGFNKKSDTEINKNPDSAFGDNPLLGALDTIRELHKERKLRIIVISDFDAVCGSSYGACQAVKKIQENSPNLLFEFEPVGVGAGSSSLYKCLTTVQSTSPEWKLPKITIDLNIAVANKAPQNGTPAEFHWMSIVAWVIYFFLGFLFLVLLAFAIMQFQYATDAVKDADVNSTNASKIKEQHSKLIRRTKVLFGLWCVVAIIFVLLWFCPLAEMPRIFRAISAWGDSRFGAAIASTVFGAYVAWFAFNLWRGGMERLKLDWAASQRSIDLKNAFEELESSRDDELSSSEVMFESFEASLRPADAREGRLMIADLRRAYEDVIEYAKEKFQSEGLRNWKRTSFRQSGKIVQRLKRHFELPDEKAEELKSVFESWKSFEKSLRTRATAYQKELEEINNKKREQTETKDE